MSKFVATKGDWTCPDPKCGNINFAKRDRCNKCAKSKPYEKRKNFKVTPAIGKQAAEKSKGLFSEDDWACKSCGNVNWSRRNTCNICNAPRINTQGSRTGYGGGFMERDEIVEYKQRDESDDEFDEFGLKKKKFRGQVPQPHSKHKPDTKRDNRESDDEDEEEEEDDEGGDLSKYDIWGDDSDDGKKDKASSSSSSGSSSRDSSSSRSSTEWSKEKDSKEKKPGRRERNSRSRSRFDERANSCLNYIFLS